MPVSLWPAVEAEVRRHFQGADTASALAALDGANFPLGSRAAPSERPRIQLACVKLAAGDLGRLEEAVALAERDWRDVLVAAGLADADWREALRRASMRVP